GGYLDQLRAPWLAWPGQIMAYSWSLRNLFFGVSNSVLGWTLLLVLAGLGCAGLVIRLCGGISVVEVFVLSDGALVAVWTSDEDLRFLIPLLPFWLLYVGTALRKLPGRTEVLVGAALLASVGVGYAAGYSRVDRGALVGGWNNPWFERMAEYIRTQ